MSNIEGGVGGECRASNGRDQAWSFEWGSQKCAHMIQEYLMFLSVYGVSIVGLSIRSFIANNQQ
jgi:hypothetical protein